MILEVAKFFYLNYPKAKDCAIDEILSMFALYEDQFCYDIVDSKVVFVAIYLRVDDKTFEKISHNPKILKRESFLLECLKKQGQNIHFIYAVGKRSSILKCLRKVIKKEEPKTVSWYKDDMKVIHNIKIRREPCLKQSQLLAPLEKSPQLLPL